MKEKNIFTIGDECEQGIIKEFKIIHDRCRVLFTGGHSLDLKYVQHKKQPFFITKDGVEVFDEQMCYTVFKNFQILPQYVFNDMKVYEGLYYFSTKEAAEKWIDENKPKYSKKQINHSINELFSPELSRDGSAFGDALKEGYRTAFFKYLENDKT